MKNAPALHRVEYALFTAFERLLGLVGHRAARATGARLGDLVWFLLRDRRRVALDNLALAMPELDAAERHRIAHASFRHLGRVACDAISALRFDAVEFCGRLQLEGWEHFEAARSLSRSRGQGLLMMTGHLGVWETTVHPVGLYGGGLHIIGRPLDNPLLDRRVTEMRTRFGNQTIPKRGAARGALRVLHDGGIVGVLVDQRVRPNEGELLPFFGQPAVTSPLLGRLAVRTGAPIVPTFAHLAPGGRYRVVLLEPIEPKGEGEDAVRSINIRCLEVIERQIRAAPGTWLWLHRRWKR